MRIILLFILNFIFYNGFGQTEFNTTFDSSNYYNYYYFFDNPNIKGHTFSTYWLQIEEALPIIVEEIKNFNCDSLKENELTKLDSGVYLQLTVSCIKSNYSFLFTQNHYAIPEVKHRKNIVCEESFKAYSQVFRGRPVGNPFWYKMKVLPKNVFWLNQNSYWYQITDNKEDNKYLVTKEVAIRILRQDIKSYLSKI